MTEINRILMCEPRHLPDAVPYTINPWMDKGKRINTTKAKEQWNTLVDTYQSLGVKVDTITQQPGLPDMVFAADQGIVSPKGVLLSNFRHPERQNETAHFKNWFTENDYPVTELPHGTYFEGNGESYRWRDKRFLGVGFRSSESTAQVLQQHLPNETVVPIEIVDSHFYHLDVGLFPLDENTVFYYPPAYSERTQQKLKQLDTDLNLVPLTENEAKNFSANSVRIGGNVVFQKGNDTFAEKISDLGYNPIPVDVSEFMKLGGGIHCLTNILE